MASPIKSSCKSCSSSHLPVATSERISEPLDLNTSNNEVVQGHSPCFLIILQQQILDKGGAEPVPHLGECLGELSLLNIPTSVLINCLKHPLPLVDVRKQGSELMDVDGARLVLVEHVDHHPACLLTEVAPVAIDQSLLQLLCINLPTPILVNSSEPLSNLRVHLLLLRGSTVTLVLGGWSSRIALLVVLRLCAITRLLWWRGSSISRLRLWGWGSSITRLLLGGWSSSITRVGTTSRITLLLRWWSSPISLAWRGSWLPRSWGSWIALRWGSRVALLWGCSTSRVWLSRSSWSRSPCPRICCSRVARHL